MSEYHEKYFKELVNIYKTRNLEFARNFAANLFPNTEDFEYLYKNIDEILNIISDFKDLPSLKKFLKE